MQVTEKGTSLVSRVILTVFISKEIKLIMVCCLAEQSRVPKL